MGAIIIDTIGDVFKPHFPLIYRFSIMEIVEIADKNDIALFQVFIVLSLFQCVPVDASLIVTCPTFKVLFVRGLHLHVINCSQPVF